MATWDDVRRLAAGLPESNEREECSWRVRDKLFAWRRPLRRRDIDELGEQAPTGEVLAVRVPDEGAKQALLAEEPDIFFTTAHFDGYPAVLIRLDRLDQDELAELLGEAWACRAPKRILRAWRAEAGT